MMTNGRGDPNNATLFINLELFREAFVFNHMGYGAAIAWLLFVIVAGASRWSCSRSPASASTTPGASDDARSPSRAPGRSRTAVRSPGSYRKFLGRAVDPMFALLIIGAYLLPLLYMVTTAFQQPGQSHDARRARSGPPRRRPATYQGKEYPIYAVPMPDGTTAT